MIAASFTDSLLSPAPAPDRADGMALYGWLVGSWTMDAEILRDDGSRFTGAGEIHAAFVLGGRAVQDVWILPGVFHGTTLRIYDPAAKAWHILWNDPVRQVSARQLGRAEGADILQLGDSREGVPLRWRFSEITPASFLWTGDVGGPDGSWRRQATYRAQRTG
jgi:hypothetical protein